MSGSGKDFELDDSFEVETSFEDEQGSKAVSARDSLLKRRLIDDLLAERRLQKTLKELDYDFDDEPDDDFEPVAGAGFNTDLNHNIGNATTGDTAPLPAHQLARAATQALDTPLPSAMNDEYNATCSHQRVNKL